MHPLDIMTFEITGLEILNRPGHLVVENHPALIDLVFLISRVPAANSIFKEKLWHILANKETL